MQRVYKENEWGKVSQRIVTRFTNDYSCYMSVYFLRGKDKAFEFYHIYEAWLSTQYNI